MRVLVTWGSKHGGTQELAQTVAAVLSADGYDVDSMDAKQALHARGFDAVVVGGALYANRWHAAARRFVRRRAKALKQVPVWFFSSGPLDDSALHAAIAPVRQVQELMERVGAQGHVTFGGRLLPGASTLLPAKFVGDWRDAAQVRAWAQTVARALPTARPLPPAEQAGRSVVPLLLHGLAGWALCGGAMVLMLSVFNEMLAVALHALVAPAVFVFLSRHYFKLRGAREPLPTAIVFTAVVVAMDAGVVAGLVQRSTALLTNVAGFWLPAALIFIATLATGVVMSMQPVAGPPPRAAT